MLHTIPFVSLVGISTFFLVKRYLMLTVKADRPYIWEKPNKQHTMYMYQYAMGQSDR